MDCEEGGRERGRWDIVVRNCMGDPADEEQGKGVFKLDSHTPCYAESPWCSSCLHRRLMPVPRHAPGI